VADFEGEKQVIYFGRSAIAGYDMEKGKARWSFSWAQTHPHVCMPLLLGDGDVLISSGYGTGSARLHISRKPDGEWTGEEIWRTNKMKAKFTNLVRVGDFIYGLDDGVLACLDVRDGTLRWRDGKYRHGQVILVGSLLLLMAEDGDVVLLDPQPGERRELTRFTALSGKTWNPPALAGQYLLVRNDREAACYRLSVVGE
jgi:outer membrane protein assembly factor BamB